MIRGRREKYKKHVHINEVEPSKRYEKKIRQERRTFQVLSWLPTTQLQ